MLKGILEGISKTLELADKATEMVAVKAYLGSSKAMLDGVIKELEPLPEPVDLHLDMSKKKERLTTEAENAKNDLM